MAPRVALAIESDGGVMIDDDGNLPAADLELGETASRACRRLLDDYRLPTDAPLRLLAVQSGTEWFEEHAELGPLQPFWVVVAADLPAKSRIPGPSRPAAEVPLTIATGRSSAAPSESQVGGAYIAALRERVGHERVFYPWCGAVVRTDQRVLLVRDRSTASWHCPGGGVEIGEAAEQTIARELDEETGLAVEAGTLLGCWTDRHVTYPNGDMVQVVSVLFSATLVGGRERPDRTGEIDARGWFSKGRLPELRPPWDRRVRLAFATEAAILE